MRTVALALPYRMSPEHNREFVDWCIENDIQAEFTRLHAETMGKDEWIAHYMIWNLTADDAQIVLAKLRWHDDMAEDWWVNALERSVADMLDWEVCDRI